MDKAIKDKTVYEIFTNEALAAFIAAKEHAARRGVLPVAPDHLFLGLLDPLEGDPDERVHGLLAALGSESSDLVTSLAANLGPAAPTSTTWRESHLELDTKLVIERAAREAKDLDAMQVDTSHLLLGLMHQRGNHTDTLLAEAGLTAEAMREAVRALPPRFTPYPTRSPLTQAIRPSLVFLSLFGIVVAAGIALAFDLAPNLAHPLTIAFIVGGWIAAVCIHEFGHCLAAFLGGDYGIVERRGLTLDPRRYGHPLLSVGLPLLFLLGGNIGLPGGVAPVDGAALRSRRWQVAVALGGPLGTLCCTFLTVLPFFFLDQETLFGGAFSLWAALAGLASLQASVLILTLLPLPPLDGFHLIAPWLPARIRDQAFGLGWAPLLLLYIVLGQSNPISDAYWQVNAQLADWLHLPDDLAAYALAMLRLR